VLLSREVNDFSYDILRAVNGAVSLPHVWGRAVNLEYAAEDTPALRNVTDTSRMFRSATSFNGSLGE
jgi:hypothetical protein